MSTVEFVPSQTGSTIVEDDPVPYTGGPFDLLWADAKLMFFCLPAVKGVLLPLSMRNQDFRNELYLGSWRNILSLVLHSVLLCFQSLFLVSLLFCGFVPIFWFAIYVGLFFLVNACITFFLNRRTIQIDSQVPVEDEEKFASEFWIYLNGVSVGRDWLQSNCDRLSETFGRRIHGVHNPTDGVLFDLIQCLIQRNFSYATQDIRDAYKLVKEALKNEKYKKIVFILHSQGGIEGSAIVDWLLDEIPQELLRRLEIYTFGNAANHFNNPHLSVKQAIEDELVVQMPHAHQAIRYIEHYANTGDFVSRYGVLSFIGVPNRFMGRLFQSPQRGHLLNQHYLSQMFPLDENRKCAKTNDFMDMEVTFSRGEQQRILREDLKTSFEACANRIGEAEVAFVGDVNTPITPVQIFSPNALNEVEREPRTIKVKDLSRLWQYRNGQSPPE